jgi:hypothetical protein
VCRQRNVSLLVHVAHASKSICKSRSTRQWAARREVNRLQHWYSKCSVMGTEQHGSFISKFPR